MPATEQTWRDQPLLHKIFAISCVILLVSTMWMMAKDHSRAWKPYQINASRVEEKFTKWREVQYETNEAKQTLEQLERKLDAARATKLPTEHLVQFLQLVRDASDPAKLPEGLPPLSQNPEAAVERIKDYARPLNEAAKEAEQRRQQYASAQRDAVGKRTVVNDKLNELTTAREALAAASGDAVKAAQAKVDQLQKEIDKMRGEAEVAESAAKAARDTLEEAEQEVARLRERFKNSAIEPILTTARFREDKALGDRKFQSALLDAAKGKLGLLLEAGKDDQVPPQQEAINNLKEDLEKKTLAYQAASKFRSDLKKEYAGMTAREDAAAKDLADQEDKAEQLVLAQQERRSNYIEWWGGVMPVPGKKWLEAPILSAFNSPLKIDNLWSEGLEQEVGSFGKVRRFDRCTTCHQAIQKTMPGSATMPAFPAERLINFVLVAPAEAEVLNTYTPDPNKTPQEQLDDQLEHVYGMELAAEGLLDSDDVTVKFVEKGSRASQVTVVKQAEKLSGEVIREGLMQPRSPALDRPDNLPGLQIGDVIASIDGDLVNSKARAAVRMLDAVGTGEPLVLTVRRGLPHPYASHPRLDLFVGSLSPHKMSEFGCTICHEGQGSATDFTWASHSPNGPEERQRWSRQYGWFDNEHWIYPMHPQRFTESGCLKCHHEVTELERSEEYPEPPAPKLMRGYHLIRKYGCYGCHEINGYDGPKRIGPDLRLEPNTFAAAQQIQYAPGTGYDKMTADEKAWIHEMIFDPGNEHVRSELLETFDVDKMLPAEQQRFSDEVHSQLAPLFKSPEHPGDLRKAGPSLRFVKRKLDNAFLFDWLRDPTHFRPSTRMPKFFGLWDHLEGSGLEVAQENEPIEIFGIVSYLNQRSQPFDYLRPPKLDPPAPGGQDEAVARGKILFQERGCLACHNHKDFPGTTAYRRPDEIVQGPDLSAIGTKFDPSRNPDGAKWLYTWIRKPNSYHVRTLMPDVKLEPIEHRDTAGKVTHMTDPASDIVAYLMTDARSDWKPASGTITQLDKAQADDLRKVTRLHLQDAFFEAQAEDYLNKGIPERMRNELKGAEKELLVPDANYEAGAKLPEQQMLAYVGRKSIAKWGCYGCHDIPGFEDAKTTGTGLAEWGTKESSKLAFEHITKYLEHGHGNGHGGGEHGDGGEHSGGSDQPPHEGDGDGRDHGDAAAGEHAGIGNDRGPMPEYYLHQIEGHKRAGFIYQKLREPRSYDYHKTENKKYNERLRMPLFNFQHDEREEVMTFVLGLVADPPSEKYVFQPDEHKAALIAGRQVLDQYNCAACHLLDTEQWKIAFEPEAIGPQKGLNPTYDFTKKDFSAGAILESAEPDRRGLRTARLSLMPTLSDDGLPRVYDSEGDEIESDGSYNPYSLEYPMDLWSPQAIDGHGYQIGLVPALNIPARRLEHRQAADGGFLARYLVTHVTAREKLVNPNAKASEAWGWLPPPLMGEGRKVQTDWLHEFLLDPYPIRPAVVLRMPQFHMSSTDATKLANYFAALDKVDYPYVYTPRRGESHLQTAANQYGERVGATESPLGRRFDDAMKIVTSGDYCVKCHLVGDFMPAGRDRAKAPDLAQIYRRLRPDYLRQWIGKPTSILPYTAMPNNILYDPQAPNLGTKVSQELYQGNSIEQVDALVDLLMNYDMYARHRSLIAPLVEQNKSATPPAEAGAGTGN